MSSPTDDDEADLVEELLGWFDIGFPGDPPEVRNELAREALTVIEAVRDRIIQVRDQAVVAVYNRPGMSYRSAGARLGISPPRVEQIVRRSRGNPPRTKRGT